MVGNVWQWCSDWYDENYYKSAPDHNPIGPASGKERVVRGASPYFVVPEDRFRAAGRLGWNPDDWTNDTGFRGASG